MTLITTHDTLGSAAPAIGTHIRQFLRTAIGATIGTPSARAIGTDSWLAHVPVALFASVMGLGGLGLAWRRAYQVLGWPSAIGETVLIAAALSFIAISLLYAVKVYYFGSAVAAEFQHPVRSNFFSAISVALLLGHAALPYHAGLAEGLWLTGAALHLLLAVIIINRWITHIFEIQQSSPVWFIPVVGNILVPLLGLQLGYTDISWFFFSVGVVFWVILFTVMLYRIIFHDPLPARLLPTLFILMAPPAVGFSGWLQLNGGQLDPLARLLFSTALFIALLLLSMAPRFLKLQFYVSWWAYTFPSAGLAIAALTYHQIVQGLGTAVLATVVLVTATAIITAVSVRTLSAIVGGRLFVPD